MFTYIYLYLILYTITYLYILNYLSHICVINSVEQMYLTYLLNILKIYTKNNPIIYLLFILSGLPPVSFFFVKFNFLITCYHNTNIFVLMLIFFNILLSMFFYLQIFNTGNNMLKVPVKTLLLLKNNKILQKQKFSHSIKNYRFFMQCVFLIFFNFFFIIYFVDLFIIFFNHHI